MTHYIYVLIHGGDHTPCKIGITENPKNRLRGYQTGSAERGYRMLHIHEVPDRETAYHIEQLIINTCREAGWWGKNEWLGCRAIMADSLIRDELELLDGQRIQREGITAVGEIEGEMEWMGKKAETS